MCVCVYVRARVCVCVFERAFKQSHPPSGGKMPVLIGGQAKAPSPMRRSGAGRIVDGFPSFFQAIPACQAVGVPSIIDHIQG